jgi:nucleoside-diphosphate-sugar epimerase
MKTPLRHILVTGGSGFFGSLLKDRLLADGFLVTNIDRVADATVHRNLTSIQADVRDENLVAQVFAASRFEAVMHCAAVLAHGCSINEHDLWTSNVDGTRRIAQACQRHGVRKLVFTSTNCLWAENMGRPVHESDIPNPIEIYGKSKLAAEQALHDYLADVNVVTLRCPTIIDRGRLGLLAILFEFIQDNKTVWVVGEGANRYQFVNAQDLATACMQALDYHQPDLFHIGSDHVQPLRAVYGAVIAEAGSHSRVRSLPKRPAVALMQLAHKLRVSPLGPYHYRMIAEDFMFDTSRIQQKLNWKSTMTNEQMLIHAYRYYANRRAEIHTRKNVSAHNKVADMGIIRLLKWIS